MPSVKLSSLPSIKRLPAYLQLIETAQKEGKDFISGTTIADELELEPIQVRKDLALTGIMGKPRVGFPVNQLIDAINTFLDWNNTHRCILIGAGHLGTALMGYPEFRRHGLHIVAAFDLDPFKNGKRVNEVEIFPIEDLARKIHELRVELAIMTVPSAYAQEICDLIVMSGIKSIWNFTNVKLKVPKDVVVQKEDLSSGYAVLSVKIARSKGLKGKFPGLGKNEDYRY